MMYTKSYVISYITTMNKGVRKLTKLGGKSIGLTLPIELVRELGWREKQKVIVHPVKLLIG